MKKITYTGLLLLLLPHLLSAQIPPGFVAKYPLDNAANDISGNNANGTLTSTTGAVNRFGSGNTATQFTSGSSFGNLPVIVTDNFSVGFWFNSTMTASSSSQWYGGNSLVDAEVCGQTNDWGTALINGGQIAFGVGNPDVTIISPLNYNDGSWHFITATRDESGSGTMVLYVDGAQVITTTGVNTGTLSAPGFLGLGRNNCTGPDYTGALDDAIFYSRALSAGEVNNLYNALNAVPLPLKWLLFAGEIAGNCVNLQWEVGEPGPNDHFDVERSTDAKNFLPIGSVQENDNVPAAGGNLIFGFVDGSPKDGNDYYRVKQVDADGGRSWSKIIVVTMPGASTGITLLFNPVHDNLVLNNPAQQMIGEMEIMDLAGRILIRPYARSRNTALTVDVSRLMPGYYLLRANGSGGAITLAFIKP